MAKRKELTLEKLMQQIMESNRLMSYHKKIGLGRLRKLTPFFKQMTADERIAWVRKNPGMAVAWLAAVGQEEGAKVFGSMENDFLELKKLWKQYKTKGKQAAGSFLQDISNLAAKLGNKLADEEDGE